MAQHFESVSGLEIAHHDLRFQERSWAVERAGQIVLGAIVALAALGLFAGGPLSSAGARDGDTGLSVSYERFMRLGRPAALVVSAPARAGNRPLAVSLPTPYLEGFDVQSITPEPRSASATSARSTWTFEPGTSRVRLVLEPTEIGIRRARLRAGGAVGLRQLVYP